MSSDHPNANATDNKTRTEQALRGSELSYRRLFEAAKDGILILDADKGRITERKRAGEKLHLRESFLSAITENQPGLLWLKDAEGRFLMVNKAFATACGRGEPERVHGLTDLDIWPKELAEKYRYDDQRVMATGNACMVEERIIIGDSQVWHETFKTSVRDDKGRIFGTTGYARDITDRKRVEEALRESQAFYHSLVEQLPAGVFRKDQAGRYVFVSSGFCRLKNMKAEEFLGKTAQEVAAGEAAHRDAVGHAVKYAGAGEDHHRLIMQTGKPIELVEEYATAAGRKQFVQSLKIPVLDLAGQIIGTQGILLDITELKQAEMALLDSEQRYRQLFDLASDAVILVDSETHRYMDVNQATQRLYGYSREEFLQMTPEDVSTEPDKTHDHIAAGDAHVPFRWHRKKNGERFAVEITANQIIHRGRRTALVTLRDITARLQAEEEIKRTAQEWQNTFDATKDAIWILDLNNRILRTNKTAEKFFKRPCSEMTGKPCWEIAHGTTEPIPNCPYVRSRKSGQRETMELQQNGRWFEDTVDPIFDAAGQYAGAVHIVSDITEHRKLEAQFRQSQKMEAIGTLAGGVAHDFNNILGVIMGYGDFILAGLEPDSPLRKYAEEVRHAADRAAGLTRQLLIFSRKQTVQPVVLDLNDVVKDLEKMLRRLIGENIEMVVVPGKAIGHIKADAGYIGQVLMNLVVNARDAMPIGGKLTLETANVSPCGVKQTNSNSLSKPITPQGEFDQDSAGRHPELKPGDYVMLTVNDTGTGMTPEVKARLFEALFTTKPAGKGTGLGLVTCQTIVQQSGGHIEVDSEVGKGTTFKIYFPRVDKPLDDASGPSQDGPMPRGTETLLLVEDEASVRHLTWHLLESLGYRVLRANNGQDALQLVHEHQGPPVRLVVTDVVMPRMGGKVMADWLKTTYPGIKILFTSGYTDDALAKQGVLEPGVAFLSKPYTPATLARKVRTMLDNETDTSILRKLKTTGNQSPPDSP
jgi:PAS domain S-box-containing protein